MTYVLVEGENSILAVIEACCWEEAQQLALNLLEDELPAEELSLELINN